MRLDPRMLALRVFVSLVLAPVLLSATAAQQLATLGPHGGDARSLAHDPRNPDRIFLGTSAGQLYVSEDGGASWSRLARLGGDAHVLDSIVIDRRNPDTMYVASWSVEDVNVGDLFRSRDGGRSWEVLPAVHGKSMRAMAIAPSDSRVLVVGTLDGVYRSRDAGKHFERISPLGHKDIKNIHSLAVDPTDPDIIYAGTFHLPWKTSDGGRSWKNIKAGLIDDSDIFSIIIDPERPSLVYVSACSGIYKSENAGEQFKKAQGIPFTARRTRVLRQDPVNRDTVYAGTTEGLWRSSDAGATWKRLTAANIIVNDVLVDPRDPRRVLLATDRSGVLASRDGGARFRASNRGFTHRHVATVLTDRERPATLYVGVLNDKEFGGVFTSDDLGESWRQMSSGLDGRDVFTLAQAGDGTLLAGTNRGIFLLAAEDEQWRPANTIVRQTTSYRMVNKKRVAVKRGSVSKLNARVYQLQVTAERWLAATAAGLLVSTDKGRTWRGGALLGEREIVGVAVRGDAIVAASRRGVFVSRDAGQNWTRSVLPPFLTKIYSVTLDGSEQVWLGTREGAMRSADLGQSWERVLAGLPARAVNSITWDPEGERLLATALGMANLFESTDRGLSWHPAETGYPLRAVAAAGRTIFAATAYDGLIRRSSGPEPIFASSGGATE